jgi:gp16 family phage-associated protein
MKTREQVTQEFEFRGESIAEWARKRSYKPGTVYAVLYGKVKAKRGLGYKIAVELGLKEGLAIPENTSESDLIDSTEFAALVGISRQKASEAMKKMHAGGSWRGVRIEVFTRRKCRSRGGLKYFVRCDSIPSQFIKTANNELIAV